MSIKGILVFICLAIGLGGCKERIIYQYAEGKIYGTFYHISYASSRDLNKEIHEQMERVNASLSMFNPHSVISQINQGKTQQTDSLFRKMFRSALKVNQATQGAYDITVAPLVNAWGFGFEKEEFPDSARIEALIKLVGMNKLRLENDCLIKEQAGMKLDASSIAKGLGVDLVAEYLEKQGVANFMVEIGGEVRVKGQSDKKRPWRIGIDRPEDDVTAQKRQLQMVVGLTTGALATSGNYRNFYVHDGKKYAHTINPQTGYPVQTEIVSASVYAKECMEADAYATAFMVTGLKEAREIITQTTGLEGYLIYKEDGTLKTWISAGLEKLVVSESKND